MADIVLGSITEFLVETTISLGAKEANRVLGLKKNLSNMRKKLKLIQAVLRDAESQQQTKEAVKRWLKELENWAFEADDVFDEFNYESHRRKMEIGNQMKRKIAFFFSCSNPIVFRVKMAHKIQKRTLSLTEIIQESKDFNLQPESDGGVNSTTNQIKFTTKRDTAFFDVTSDFVGRNDEVSKMVADLTAKKDRSVSVIPIFGMGGIGKTTLARRLFSHPKVGQHFEKSIWVCISKIEVNRLLQLIQQSLGMSTTNEESTQARVNHLRKELKDKRYLLVLDDVWDKSEWDAFLNILKDISSTTVGNCILVTTRQQEVVSSVGTSPSSPFLKNLSDDECWLILKKKAFDSREVLPGLEHIGLEIAQKCQGLPLAASVLGGMLRNKGINEWLSISKSGLQTSGGDENSIEQILRLSYDYLPYSSLKKCFAYLSNFPKDSELKRDKIIQLWIAEGFLHPNPRIKMEMEDIGDMFFNILLQYSLLQEEKTDDYGNILHCKMHDLVHDLALAISGSKTLNLQDSGRYKDDADSIRYLALDDEGGKEMESNMKERFSAYNCGGSSKHSDSTGQLVKRIFPALKSLSLKRMLKLIEWVEANDLPTTGVVFFPVLEELTIKLCDNLASFPNAVPRLKRLDVRDVMLESSTLAKICSQTSALTDLGLYMVGGLVSLPDSMLFDMPNLRTLKLRGCEELIQLWKADDDEAQDLEVENCEPLGQSRDVLPSIEELEIGYCNNLQSIQIPNGHQCLASLRSLRIDSCNRLTHISSELVKSTTSLETLIVYWCPELVSFPVDLQNLTTLSCFYILGCQNYSMPEGLPFLTRVGRFGLGPFSNSTEYHSTLYLSNAFQNMSSLRRLALGGFESWDSLPDQLQYLSALESLHLYYFGVKRLPDWFEKLASLQQLNLYDFKELEYLPSEQSMRRLKLSELHISNSPKLKERLAQQRGPNCERSKISQICFLIIDGEYI